MWCIALRLALLLVVEVTRKSEDENEDEPFPRLRWPTESIGRFSEVNECFPIVTAEEQPLDFLAGESDDPAQRETAAAIMLAFHDVFMRHCGPKRPPTWEFMRVPRPEGVGALFLSWRACQWRSGKRKFTSKTFSLRQRSFRLAATTRCGDIPSHAQDSVVVHRFTPTIHNIFAWWTQPSHQVIHNARHSQTDAFASRP